MNINKNSNFFKLNIILITLYLLTLIFFIFTDNSSGLDLNRKNIASFNEGWTIKYNDKIEDTAILPKNYHLEPGSVYSIERIINKEDFIYPLLRIRSSMMNVHAYIDNELIYSYELNQTNQNINTPFPSSWQIIEIPIEDSMGKKLTLTFSSQTTQFSGLLNTILIGNGEAIIINLIEQNYLNIISSTLILFISIFGLITLFWTKKLGIKKHIIYLSLFGIVASLWILSESTLLQLFTSNRFIISSTSYVMNLGLPLVITLFIIDVVLDGFKKLYPIFATSIISIMIIELILQLSGKMYFITSTLISIAMIVICAITLISCLVYEGFKKENQKAKHYLSVLSIFIIFSSIIMGLFIFGVYQHLGKFLALGVLVFYFSVLIDAIKSITSLMETKNKSIIYKQLAYQDFLTKGYNRAAFEKDVEELINQNKLFRLVLLDLNHLKIINDTFGHPEGDYAIIECFNALNKSINDKGKCYRISGDEFACIIYDTSNKIYDKYKKQINRYLSEKSVKKPYNIVLAFGTKIYNDHDNFTDFYKQVDIEMYKHKKILKIQESRNI